jgi:hypothetical protein
MFRFPYSSHAKGSTIPLAVLFKNNARVSVFRHFALKCREKRLFLRRFSILQ